MMLRSVAMAAVSFADRPAARRVGIAMAAMMAMIAITIISSISVKPFWLRDMEAGLLVGSWGTRPRASPRFRLVGKTRAPSLEGACLERRPSRLGEGPADDPVPFEPAPV